MLLMIEKSIRGGIRNANHQHAEVNNKYMKDYDKNKESKILGVNNLYGCAMLQKISVESFEWLKETSKSNM